MTARGWRVAPKKQCKPPGEPGEADSLHTAETASCSDWSEESSASTAGSKDVGLPVRAMVPPASITFDSKALTPEPDCVVAMPRLFDDVKALMTLCEGDIAPWRRMRPKSSAFVLYGFADASGPSWGAGGEFAHEDLAHVELGQWISSVTTEESSNWQELGNLVEYLESMAAQGRLTDVEVFMFTENSTAEVAFWKGTSRSKKLCDLVLRLRCLEKETDAILHVVHVSGKRMIATGVDGLSRGDHFHPTTPPIGPSNHPSMYVITQLCRTSRR